MKKNQIQKPIKILLIPITIFVSAYLIYSYNLEGQPWHGDEVLYDAWGGVFFTQIKHGDFDNVCLKTLDGCTQLYNPPRTGWEVNYLPVRNFFVGLGQYITTGTNSGDFYTWSCYWSDCMDKTKIPTLSEFAAGRFFSPIFGALTVLLAYFIGKIIFTKFTGIVFSLLLLFHPLWLWNSRVAMTEVYVSFFMLLTIFLLIYSLKNKNKFQILFFILSGISFGISINTKETAFLILPIIIGSIPLLIYYYKEEIKKVSIKKVYKSILFIMLFIFSTFIAFYATNPINYSHFLEHVNLMHHETSSFSLGFITPPSLENDNVFRTLATIHSTIIPYFFNYYDQPSKESGRSLSWTGPQTYTTIPIMIFFFIGLGYLIYEISKKNASFSEYFLLGWFVSVGIFTALIVKEFYIERYYLSLQFPLMLISSYAVYRFTRDIDTNMTKIFIAVLFICHSLTTLSFWKTIYFSAGDMWGNPMVSVTLQKSLEYSQVVITDMCFIIFLSFMFYFYKIRRIQKI